MKNVWFSQRKRQFQHAMPCGAFSACLDKTRKRKTFFSWNLVYPLEDNRTNFFQKRFFTKNRRRVMLKIAFAWGKTRHRWNLAEMKLRSKSTNASGFLINFRKSNLWWFRINHYFFTYGFSRFSDEQICKFRKFLQICVQILIHYTANAGEASCKFAKLPFGGI